MLWLTSEAGKSPWADLISICISLLQISTTCSPNLMTLTKYYTLFSCKGTSPLVHFDQQSLVPSARHLEIRLNQLCAASAGLWQQHLEDPPNKRQWKPVWELHSLGNHPTNDYLKVLFHLHFPRKQLHWKPGNHWAPDPLHFTLGDTFQAQLEASADKFRLDCWIFVSFIQENWTVAKAATVKVASSTCSSLYFSMIFQKPGIITGHGQS